MIGIRRVAARSGFGAARALAPLGLLAAAAVLSTVVAGAALGAANDASSPPASIGPIRTAWYDATYPQPAAVPPPAPPGVDAHDLVVSGVTIGTSSQATAISALRFDVPGGATAATLTLPLASAPSTAAADGQLPIGVTPEACPASSTFATGGRQPWSAVPAYDCSGRTSVGQLSADGSAVVFSDIGAVARGDVLAFVILPGTTGADRLVFAPPTGTSLTLLDFDSAPTFDASGHDVTAASHPATGTPTGGSARPPVTRGTAGAGNLVPPAGGGLTAHAAGAVAGQKPALAAAPTTRVAGSGLRALSAVDDAATRLALLAGLVALVQGTLLLALTDEGERRSARWAALRAAWAGEAVPPRPAKEWGVGRHRGPRNGPTPLI